MPGRKWTILIYQAGDNNLTEEMVYALNEMKEALPAYSSADRELDVIVQFDPVGRGNPTRRFHLNRPRPEGDGTLECDELIDEQKPEVDTSSPAVLLDFLISSIEDFQAEKYMLVLSGHGAGLFEGFFLQDETRPLTTIPSSFPIRLLKDVFRDENLERALNGGKINILGFDACLMSMVEVCYQMRSSDILDLIVGSEGFTLNSGWPYKEILSRLVHCPDIEPTPFAEEIVSEYIDFYRTYYLGGLSVDMEVLKLARIGDLREEVDKLADALIEEFKKRLPGARGLVRLERQMEDDGRYEEAGEPFQDALLLAHWAAQSYNGEQCVDLYDFCGQLRLRLSSLRDDKKKDGNDYDAVLSACRRVMNLIKRGADRLILKSCYNGPAFQFSHGVSIYFPWGDFDIDPTYRSLDFGVESKWLKFLRLYLKATKRRQRDPRGFRAGPPAGKGPTVRIHSMRNPPTSFALVECDGTGKVGPDAASRVKSRPSTGKSKELQAGKRQGRVQASGRKKA